MKLAKSILVATALAFGAGIAYAADDKAANNFNEMDKNADGKLTRAEAKGNKDLIARWKEADKNNDGVVTRAEYLQVMAKVDANKAKEKVMGAGREVKEEATEAKRRAPKGEPQPAASGSTSNGKPK